MNLDLKLKESEEIDSKIDSAGLDTLEYNKRWGLYRIRLGKGDLKKHADALKELMRMAFDYRAG